MKKRLKKLLAVDPGTRTVGVALLEGLKELIMVKKIKLPEKESIQSRMRKLASEITKIILKHKPEVMVIENQYIPPQV